ncbi:MAG: T9SS type A sorting domain-containing protein [Ferruginibacter sp.]
MKKTVLLIIALVVFYSFNTNCQILRAFTPRYTNSSVRGSIVYVSNSIVSTSGISIGSPGTGEVPPGGSTTNNGGTGIDIDVDNPPPVTKLAFGSLWNYLTIGASPANDGSGNTWIQSPYLLTGPWNTGGIGSGAGKYGYNASESTCLFSGCLPVCTPATSCNKFTAYYFRQNVNFTAAELTTTFQSIRLNVKRDDGIVIYINGIERARNNMPVGVPVYGTLATANIAVGAAEDVTFSLSPAFFTAGANTIAVEVHLNKAKSADMSYDMEVSGISDGGTHNSSTADLNLPTCSTVLFAGLYWGAGEGSNTGSTAWITGETTCKLKLPGAGAYTTITSTQNDYHNPTLIPGYSHTGYKCFKDITSLVNALNPNGTYTVANVLSPLGIGDAYGGWTIVIVYANPSLTPQNLTVFDGNAGVKSGSGNVDVGISGFLTPPSGTVSCELGAVVYDGDRTSTDGYAFKQNGAPSFYDLTPTVNNPTSNINDMWNSVVAYKGVVVTTRNPAFQNTLGYDANIINLPNAANAQLSNSQTAATVRFFSPSENYIVQVLTTAISQYTPSFSFDKTATDINGGSLIAGDSIRYQINYNNVGNDASISSFIYDNIPAGATFLRGSIKINGVAKTDAASDDQAEYQLVNNRVVFRLGTGATATLGGNVASGVSGNVQFDVVLASSCAVLACAGTIKNSARINYIGQTSGLSLYDSSGVNTAGCITTGPVLSTVGGSCRNYGDTIITNICPSLNILLPWRLYAGYTIYAATPFVPANIYDPTIPITTSRVYWAYFNNGTGCSDTIKINAFIMACPDIDDDNDGIPDYVELNNPLALQDANSNGIPNWNDPTYPGFVDNNADGFNDNFVPSADSDNDGIPNFYDVNFPGYVDSNGDGVDDTMDKDLDGIPNHLDLDSDNDGIPDVVESYGVDANGDGVIDNYSTSDLDGFSQNVDGSNAGVPGSGNGLGAQDLDGDGLPNYLDSDSDNDGIPDIIEAGGTDSNYDGKVDGFVDLDGDGYSDPIDGDVGNDGTAENSANTLLRTGADINGDGRADSYPYKNLDNDRRANPYDLDSDGDGIVDVVEAGFIDANFDGFVDGPRNGDGWNTALHNVTLNLRDTDGRGNPDYLDIDADDDGIPDNIEGLATASYTFPTYLDTDNDGIDNAYDLAPYAAIFGGAGIFPYDNDVDGIPDYRDLDTDSDGVPDIIEGNDFNRNGIADDNVTLTFLDTDGDGLDNRFDSLNSVSNVRGTSYNMGAGGTTFGDATPGSRCPVQKTLVVQPDRDWRYAGYLLQVQLLQFSATGQSDNKVFLTWSIITPQLLSLFEVERSTDSRTFIKVSSLPGEGVPLNEIKGFSVFDEVSNVSSRVIFYRLKITGANGQIKYSNILLVRKGNENDVTTSVQPNPAADFVTIRMLSSTEKYVTIRLVDNVGKTVLIQKQKLSIGENSFQLVGLSGFSNGVYSLQVLMQNEIIMKKLLISNR